jgi:hypothetical protein
MRTHHVNPAKYEAAKASGNIMRVMMLKADCGSKSTARATVFMKPSWDGVDCVKCLAKRPQD